MKSKTILNKITSSNVNNYFNIFISLLGTLLIVFTNSLRAAYLNPIQLGFISVLFNYSSVISIFGLIGPSHALSRFLNGFEKKDKFGLLLIIITFSLLITSLIFLILFVFSFFLSDSFLLFIKRNFIMLFFLVLLPIFQSHFSQYFKFIKLSVVTNLIENIFFRLINLIFLSFFLTGFINFDNYIFLLILSYILVLISYIILLLIFIEFSAPSFSFVNIFFLKKILLFASIMFISGSFSFLVLHLDIFFLSFSQSFELIALYSVAIFLSSFLAIIDSSLSLLSIPMLINSFDLNSLSRLKFTFYKNLFNRFYFGFFSVLFLIFSYYLLVDFFPYSRNLLVSVSISLTLGKFINLIFGMNTEVIIYSNHHVNSIFFGLSQLIISILLLSLFTPLIGIFGASLSSLLSYLINNSIRFLFISKRFSIKYPFITVIKYFIIITILTLYYGIILLFDFPYFLSLFIYGVTSIFIYDSLIHLIGIKQTTVTSIIFNALLRNLKRV